MLLPPFATTSLDKEAVAAALEAVPATAGVGQILGPEGRNLVIGRPASLRRWAATQLGAGRPRRPGVRPPLDLRPIATALTYAVTTTSFLQRLLFERLMSRHVPPSTRRDLKAPAYLHLDEKERFPRMTVRADAGRRACLFGPFRSPLEAGRAREALHKLFPLRPCDYVFEPDPALALGLGCIYAQIRTCSAPCLVRIGEDDYRSLAGEAAAFLAQPTSRSGAKADCVPSWVAAAEDSRGIVAEPGPDGIELYPVRAGAVLEEESRVAVSQGLEEALASLRWSAPDAPRDDWPWLLAWLNTRRHSGRYIALGTTSDASDLAAGLRTALEPSCG